MLQPRDCLTPFLVGAESGECGDIRLRGLELLRLAELANVQFLFEPGHLGAEPGRFGFLGFGFASHWSPFFVAVAIPRTLSKCDTRMAPRQRKRALASACRAWQS